MATLDQAPPQSYERGTDAPNVLNSALARVYTINWETVYYIVVFLVAVASRFVNLGDRVMSHDESLHTKYSYDLYTEGRFQHTPLMHGPILFHMVALSYFLFGDSDFSARIYPAVLGIIMVLMPKLLFQRWLGKFGAMATSLFILISPMLLFHSRYIREDTPAIFYTMLMVYAVFAYIDGVRPRQPKFLILLSAATLLNLGSKETAFMYILIFAAFVGAFLIFQIVQQWRRGTHSSIVGWTVVGTAVVPLAGILASLLVVQLNVANVAEDLTVGPLLISKDVVNLILFMLVGLPLAFGIAALMMFVIQTVNRLAIGKPLDAILGEVGLHAMSWFKLIFAGITLGAVAALLMTNVLSIIPPEGIQQSFASEAKLLAENSPIPEPTAAAMQGRLLFWTASIALVLGSVVIITVLVRFNRRPSLPWADILIVATSALATAFVLVFLEERSRLASDAIKQIRQYTGNYNHAWIYGAWVVGGLSIAGIVLLRLATTFWQQMRRYPAFDILLLIGSLVLPWSAAFVIFQAGYNLEQTNYTQRDISAMIIAVIPFIGVSIAAGLAWRPIIWGVCTATFYAIFAFFFTTIFTNPNGVATGIVGSLGYWLAQQGERRGSQPQYYYMLIQLPIYEYLVVIGAGLAGIVGMAGVWRYRVQRHEELEAERAARIAEADVNFAQPESATEDVPVAEESHRAETLTPNSTQALRPNGEAMAYSPSDMDTPQESSEEAPVDQMDQEDQFPARIKDPIAVSERLEFPPFITFVGFWALMITYALTLAGEKMPWLTTHIALPCTFLAGWYVGRVMESVDWQKFFKQSWVALILFPIFTVGVLAMVGPYLFPNTPFSGSLSREDQMRTFTWLGAALLTGLVGYALFRIWRAIGTGQIIKVGVLGAFVLLSILTARHAWMAAYINYDLPTEFMVYAHSAPQNKTVINYLEEISRRTTDGMSIRVAYDEKVSWPGSWYFRKFTRADFIGNTSGATNLDQYVGIVVGAENAPKIEPQLGDRFYKFDLNRLWWPMQEYFYLNMKRIDDAFADEDMRLALWEIWWNRDYTQYTKAYEKMTGNTNTKFELERWPVADRMVFFVRKDVAAQIWDFGTGQAKVGGLPEDPFANLRCDVCSADYSIGPDAGGLANPRGIAVSPDGLIYVVDNQKGRIAVFDREGRFVRQIGQRSPAKSAEGPNPPAPQGTFEDAWGIAVSKDGLVIVADTWNHRIQVFDKDGNFVRMWGGALERVEPGTKGTDFGFFGPRAVAVDAQNNVYVADTGNHRIRVYTIEGKYLYDFGLYGPEPGQMKEPVGLAINDRTQEIYVANTWNKRVDVYRLDGGYQRSITIPGWSATNERGPDTYNRPYLALDPTGTYLFVTDPDAGRVLVYLDRSPVLTFGRIGTTAYSFTQFGVLGGVAFAKDGTLFMVDAGSGRVLRFPQSSLPGLRLAIFPEATVPTAEAGTAAATESSTTAATAVPTLEPTQEPTQAGTDSVF